MERLLGIVTREASTRPGSRFFFRRRGILLILQLSTFLIERADQRWLSCQQHTIFV